MPTEQPSFAERCRQMRDAAEELKEIAEMVALAAIRAGALRWMWLCVSMRSKPTCARPILKAAAAGNNANNSRLVISIVYLHESAYRRWR